MSSPTGDTDPASPPPTAPPTPPSESRRPGPAELLPAVVAPLLALGATLAGAVVVLVVLLLASLTGLDTSDLDPSGTAGDGGLLSLLGLPVQLAAMGLFGTLSLDVSAGGQVAGASVFAPVYVLTAVYVSALTVAARRRAVLRSPVAIGVATATAAVVAVLATRLLAVRSDGAVLHAASPTLLFATAALTAGTLGVARWRASGGALPSGTAPYVEGLRVVRVQLVVAAAVLTPLLLVAAAVGEGLGAAIAALVLLPTALVYGFGLGTLAPVSAAGSSEHLWGDSAVTAALLVLVVVLGALAAALARHLRRGTPATADAAGWAALPAAWAVVGLALWLASLLVVSGGFAGFDGSARVQLGWSLLLLMPLWGLGVEAASRYVAPVLAPRLPPRVSERLRGRVPDGTGTPAPARELTEAERLRLRRGLLVGGGVLGVVVAVVVAVGMVNSVFYGPGAAADDYLDALVDGDVERVVELAPPTIEPGSALLTDDVYDATEGRPTGYEITDSAEYGDSARLSVTLEGVAGDGEVDLALSRTGSRFGLFDVYEVDDVGLASPLTLGVIETPEQITVNGVEVDPESADQLWALPGAYAIDPYGDSPWVETEPVTVDVSPADFGTLVETSAPEPSERLVDEVQAQVDAWLEDCLTRDELDPDGCPQSTFAFGEDVRDVNWTLQTPPTVELDYFDGSFPVSFTGSGGSASVTYESDQSYGYGRPDFQRDTDTSELYFGGTADIVDGEVRTTFEAY